MIRSLPLALLAGCPYVFGPADLSHVPPADGPAPTGDTAPEPPTGDTAPPLLGPAITELQANPVLDGVFILARFTPVGALATGGTLLVSVDGAAPLETPIPGEASLGRDGDTVQWILPVVGACDGIGLDLSVSIRDSLGEVGPAATASVDLLGLGRVGEQAGAVDLGTVTPPVLFCGVADTPGDFDRVQFQPTVGGLVEFVLSWPDLGQVYDLDFTLYQDGMPVANALSIRMPEILTGELAVGPVYVLEISHFGGMTPYDWLMAILPEPVATTGGTGDTGP